MKRSRCLPDRVRVSWKGADNRCRCSLGVASVSGFCQEVSVTLGGLSLPLPLVFAKPCPPQRSLVGLWRSASPKAGRLRSRWTGWPISSNRLTSSPTPRCRSSPGDVGPRCPTASRWVPPPQSRFSCRESSTCRASRRTLSAHSTAKTHARSPPPSSNVSGIHRGGLYSHLLHPVELPGSPQHHDRA